MITLYLTLLNSGVKPITHGRNLQPRLPLPVALSEELLHDPLHPLPIELQRFRRVGQISAVDHVLKDLDAVVVVVEKEDPGAGHLLGLHHRLEVGEKGHVLGHVGGQDHVDDHLAEGLPLL